MVIIANLANLDGKIMFIQGRKCSRIWGWRDLASSISIGIPITGLVRLTNVPSIKSIFMQKKKNIQTTPSLLINGRLIKMHWDGPKDKNNDSSREKKTDHRLVPPIMSIPPRAVLFHRASSPKPSL
jgi:hypothetical protein